MSEFREYIRSGIPVEVRICGKVVVSPRDSKGIRFVEKLIKYGLVTEVKPVKLNSSSKASCVSKITVMRVYSYLVKQKYPVSVSKIALSLKLSRSTVRRALRKLLLEGKVKRIGAGSSIKYVVVDNNERQILQESLFS